MLRFGLMFIQCLCRAYLGLVWVGVGFISGWSEVYLELVYSLFKFASGLFNVI